jgi:hypothetical protein
MMHAPVSQYGNAGWLHTNGEWVRADDAGISDFVEKMQPTDHVAMFYTQPRRKQRILLSYFGSALARGYAVCYVAGKHESLIEFRDSLNKSGVGLERLEKSGALRLVTCKDWYLEGGEFNETRILQSWVRLHEQSVARGFQGVMAVGETDCMLKNGMVKGLVQYETNLHPKFDIPLSAICVYDSMLLNVHPNGHEVHRLLLLAHRTVILVGGDPCVFNAGSFVEIGACLVQCVEETISQVLGRKVADALFHTLQANHGIVRDELPYRLETLTSLLTSLGVAGTEVLERAIARRLYKKVGLEFNVTAGYRLAEYVEDAKRMLITGS